MNKGHFKKKELYLKLDPTRAPDKRKGLRISYVSSYKFHKVKKQQHGYDLTIEDVARLLVLNCNYCGRVPNISDPLAPSPYNGIDRIDSDKGYFKDNVVTCCKTCNFAKNTLTNEEFFAWVSNIYSHLKKKGLVS